MRVEPARVGSRGIDCVTSIDIVHAQGLKKIGAEFVIRYLGSVTPAERDCILSAGLGLGVVTYASAHDGIAAVAAAKALQLPIGAEIWRDLEGPKTLQIDPGDLQDDLNDFFNRVLGAGYTPKLYCGAPQPLTSEELWKLKAVGYWKGQGRCVDRFNKLAEPTGCGWQLLQCWPSQWAAGIWSDWNIVTSDYKGRTPAWVVA